MREGEKKKTLKLNHETTSSCLDQRNNPYLVQTWQAPYQFSSVNLLQTDTARQFILRAPRIFVRFCKVLFFLCNGRRRRRKKKLNNYGNITKYFILFKKNKDSISIVRRHLDTITSLAYEQTWGARTIRLNQCDLFTLIMIYYYLSSYRTSAKHFTENIYCIKQLNRQHNVDSYNVIHNIFILTLPNILVQWHSSADKIIYHKKIYQMCIYSNTSKYKEMKN